MYKVFILLGGLLLTSEAVWAQPEFKYTGPAATISDSIPLNNDDAGRRQMLYHPSDFQGAPSGSISVIYFRGAPGDVGGFATLTVKMGYTHLDSFVSGGFVAGPDTVYHGDNVQIIADSNGWIRLQLQRPFYYDHTQRFIVDVRQQSPDPGIGLLFADVGMPRSLSGPATGGAATDTTLLADFGFDMCLPGKVAVTTPGVRCGSGSVALVASVGPKTRLKWYAAISGGRSLHTGSIFNTPAITATTDFFVAADSQSCESKRIPVTATVLPSVTATIQLNGSAVLCSGDSTHLEAMPGAGFSYQWQQNGLDIPGATDLLYTVTETGYYRLIVSKDDICRDTTFPEVITVNPLPNPIIYTGPGMLFTDSFQAYQWIFDGQPVPGAVGREFFPHQDGEHTVTVTDENGCSYTSGTYMVRLGTAAVAGDIEAVHVYPNPATTSVFIHMPGDAKATISTFDGKVRLHCDKRGEVSLSTFEPGVYLIRVHGGQGKILKNEVLIRLP